MNAIYIGVKNIAFILAVFLAAACSQTPQIPPPPLVQGLDHIPLVVTDLQTAAENYRVLGFTLKPGRIHKNGLRNQHIKFPDGTEIELITAQEARDPLSAEYLQILSSGEGAAFVGFYTPDLDRLTGWLEEAGKNHRSENGLLAFPEAAPLRYLFFGNRAPSPTDQPAHFEHPNGAVALAGVWIAAEDLAEEQQLLTALGAMISRQEVHVPDRFTVLVARFPEAEVVFLPESQQLIPGRRIVGAILRTSDLEAMQNLLAAASLEIPPLIQTDRGRSLILPPELTHGLWLEFRENTDD